MSIWVLDPLGIGLNPKTINFAWAEVVASEKKKRGPQYRPGNTIVGTPQNGGIPNSES